LTSKQKPYTYVSTIGVGDQIKPSKFTEDADIRVISPTRKINDSYANGYGNSKWAGEVLLREAHDLCGLPVAVFRCASFQAYDVMNPYDDGIGFDEFVDWRIDAG
jgi:fatty acid CoA ligase FadD9